MIRLVLVTSFILILGFYEAKSESNDLPLKNGETSTPYQSIEEKTAEVAAYGRVVEGKNPESPLPLVVTTAALTTLAYIGGKLYKALFFRAAWNAVANAPAKEKSRK
ncbi:uncharacterized protein LOC128983182 [Macrosteles quadrilineatus]|uniref:uncharacterized protein LOC128983182 n=1 Tax=Macrosteles quadrilineatus TaxID=74068 RepID=UPI0023E1EE52|nr:uncharacterized protein LOC128983182 [Macrosteles quadrilineatus]